jgi:hypothetical protein
MLAQTDNDNLKILSLQVSTQRQKMHFGAASGKRIDQMKNLHQQPLSLTNDARANLSVVVNVNFTF